MKRLALLLAIPALFLAGCSKEEAPTAADPNTTKYTFTAQLSPANEVPPVGGPESTGSGSVTITMFIAKDAAGNPNSASIDFDATFSGFPPGTALTAAHIHPGVAGTNGGVLVSTSITAGEITFPAGSGSLSKKSLFLSADNATAIAANPSAYYFNVHTAANPGGVARGQLKAS
jgi:hypothetical protein